jgi:hypothetical protein
MPRLPLLPLLLLALPLSVGAQAPHRAAPADHWQPWQPSEAVALDPAMDGWEVGGVDMALTALGATAGLGLVFLASSAVLMQGFSGTGPSSRDASAAALLFVTGGTLAGPYGAHLGNRRRGDLWSGIVVTGVAMAASVAALALIDEPPRSFAIAIPIALIATPTITELVTTHPPAH